MTPCDFLLAVRGLLTEPEHWFKGGLSRNCDGAKVSIHHPRASQFTIDGAFCRVMHITKADAGPAYSILKRAIHPASAVIVAHFNNAHGTTHYAVLQMIDKAIRLAGGVPPVVEGEEQ